MTTAGHKLLVTRILILSGLAVCVCANGMVAAGQFRPGLDYTWSGCDCDGLVATGGTITDARLVLQGLAPGSADPNATLQVHLVDDPPAGLEAHDRFGRHGLAGTSFITAIPVSAGQPGGATPVVEFDAVNDPSSWVWKAFASPLAFRLADGSAVQYSSALLEMIDAAGTGSGFGLGFQTDTPYGIRWERLDLLIWTDMFKGVSQPGCTTWTLFSEDFSGGDLHLWTVVNEGTLQPRWLVSEGLLTQLSNTATLDGDDIGKPGTYLAYRPGADLKDYTVSITIRSGDDDAMGLMFRCRDNDNYYRFSWDLDRVRGYRRLVKKSGGSFTLLAQDHVPYIKDRPYRLMVRVLGTLIEVSVDGEPVFSVEDDSVQSGTVAPYTWANAPTHFDDMQIQSLAVNHGPQWEPIADETISENAELTFVVNAADPEGKPLTYSVENLPEGAGLTGRTFTWTPTHEQAGTRSLTFVADDGQVRSRQTMTIRVTAANRPPVWSPVADQTALSGQRFTLTLHAADPEGGPVRYSLVNRVQGAILLGNTFMWTPDYSQTGIHELTFVADDGRDSATTTVVVRVE